METVETPDLLPERHVAPENVKILKKEIVETVEIEIPELTTKELGILKSVCEILKSNKVKILNNYQDNSTQNIICIVEWRHI